MSGIRIAPATGGTRRRVCSVYQPRSAHGLMGTVKRVWWAGIVAVAACSADGISGLPATAVFPAAAPDQSAALALAIDGAWNWTRVVRLTAPPWVAQQIFGIVPEGPVTHIRCESTGLMTLNQTNESFSGSASTNTNDCETNGAQIFTGTLPAVLITDGQVTGRRVEFMWVEDGMLFCPHHGVASGADGGLANQLDGTGRCIVPGHPKSAAPLPPPPAGTSKTVSWTAARVIPE